MPRYRCPKCGYTYRDIVFQCPICHVKFHYPGMKNPEINKEEKKEAEVIAENVVDMPATKYEELPPELPLIEEEEVKPEPQIVYIEKEPSVKLVDIDQNAPSYFDGRLIQLIGWTLLGALVTIFTLTICFPLAYAWIIKWECKHTVVNGYRQRFDGVAGSLIPRWILWTFLTIITLTIFGWWTPIRLRKWKVARIVLVKEEE